MVRRGALLVIFLSMVVIGLGYASAYLPGGVPKFATYAFAIATASMSTAVLVLGAARKRTSLGGLWFVFGFIFLVLAFGFAAALSQTTVNSARLWLGLPAGAATILYVVGLAPMAVLPVAYALTFEKTTLSDAELIELRRKLDALKATAEPQ
jgi:cytochrome c biogenesis protein CcdA